MSIISTCMDTDKHQAIVGGTPSMQRSYVQHPSIYLHKWHPKALQLRDQPPVQRPVSLLWIDNLKRIAQVVQVTGCHEPIPAVVAGPSEHEHARTRGGWVFCSQCVGDAQAGEFHELVNAEAEGAHELLVDGDRLLLAPAGISV